MHKLTFANLNDRMQGIFGSEENFEGFRNLRQDLRDGVKIFNEEGAEVNKKEAENMVLAYCLNILGLTKDSSKRDIHRALKKHGTELFEVIEEDIDFQVEEGFKESEFFNKFVDMRNLKRGDRNEFWTEDEVLLSVVKIAGDHHDFCKIESV